MKKQLIIGAMLALSGCVQVDDFTSTVRHPAPKGLVGYWQSSGPQSKLVSPEAIASLIVTPEGDTLDCRQWQRVVAVPGKLMPKGDNWYNITQMQDFYRIGQDGATLEYDGMTLQRVDKPTLECAQALAKKRVIGVTP